MKLSKSEENLMGILWELQEAAMKDIIKQHDDPKPAPTTIATLLKRMTDKEYISYKPGSKPRIYFPTINKDTYFSKHVNNLVERFFGNSSLQFASFLTKKADLNSEELLKLRAIINQQLKDISDE